jgi:rhodanese-related sulfurtransferase
MSQPAWIITCDELRKELASKNAPKLLDVRQPEEFEESHIEGCILIPLGELEERAGELAKDDDIVAYCAAGMRSLQAVMMLKQLGFKKVRSLDGGIHAWEET